MQKLPIVLAAILFAALGLSPNRALALNGRSFVSAQGSDANSCSPAAPCRTLQVAVNNTNAGGEVVVLNSAGYGIVTINKEITISSIGVEGSITAGSGQTAITINAGAGDHVRLVGLTLIGAGLGSNGILIQSAQEVAIRDTRMTGFLQDGIKLTDGAAGLTVNHVAVEDNGNVGIDIVPNAANGSGAGIVSAYLNDVDAAGNNTADVLIDSTNLGSSGTVSALLSDIHVGRSPVGIQVQGTGSSAQAVAMITGSRLFANQTGLVTSGLAPVVFLDRTQISGNATGVSVGVTGTVLTYANNEINGNGTDVSGTLSPVANK
jgi:hypothetical protein